ncbi:MAG: MATE family efflux transporter [Candidatus Omnitrophota bacterium]
MNCSAHLTRGPVGPMLLQKTLPMLLGMMALMAFNLADTYFIGLLGTRELAAMSFTFPVVLLVISIGIGLGAGASSIISRTIGQGDFVKVRRLTTDCLLLALLTSILIALIGFFSIDPLFSFLGAQEDIRPLTAQYMRVWYAGLPFLIIPMVGNHAIRATGDMLIPGLIMVFAAILNIILDPIFIFGWGRFPAMGIAGAAWATVLSRFVTVFLSLGVLAWREKMLSFGMPLWRDVRESWKEILYVGVPATGVNLLVAVGIGIVTRLVSPYGPAVVAGYGVAHRVEAVCLHIYMALCAVVAPAVGQNWGREDLGRVKSILQLSFRFSWAWAVLVACGLAVFAEPLIRIFDQDPAVVRAGTLFLWIVPFSYGAEAMIMISSTAFNAIRRPGIAISMVALRMVILFLPLALLMRIWQGYAGVFLAVAATNILVGGGVWLWDRYFFFTHVHSER